MSGQAELFDPDDMGPVKDCPYCAGKKGRFSDDGDWLPCPNCDGTGVARIPY